MARHARSEQLFVTLHCFTLYRVMRKFTIPSMSSKLRVYGMWWDFDETCTLEDVLGNLNFRITIYNVKQCIFTNNCSLGTCLAILKSSVSVLRDKGNGALILSRPPAFSCTLSSTTAWPWTGCLTGVSKNHQNGFKKYCCFLPMFLTLRCRTTTVMVPNLQPNGVFW